MIITLDELNRCIAALPNPHIAREMNRKQWRVAIEPDMHARPLYDNPDPIGPAVKIATFELRKIAHLGTIGYRWASMDELII